jgi:anaerobic selenocysteine-containing dehydrogenase
LIDQALATDDLRFTGITRERLEQEHRALIRMAAPDGSTLPFSTPAWFRTPSGRAELTPVPVFSAPAESRANAAAYPLEFLPRKADNYMNSTFANIPLHQRMEAKTAGILEMHGSDAAPRNIAEGDDVEVFNQRGSIRLRAHVNGHVPSGVVAARLDWNKLTRDGNNINALTSERLTDIGGGATFYSTLVEVRRLSPSIHE